MRIISARLPAIALGVALVCAHTAYAQRNAPLRNEVSTRLSTMDACFARLSEAERAARFRAQSETARPDIRWSFSSAADKGPYRAFSAARNVMTRTADTRVDAVYIYEYSCVGPVFHEVSDAWVEERPRAEPFKF